jgi:hypothetical protein
MDEEIELKRKMLNHMIESDKSYAASMEKIAKTMNSFANSMATIAQCFAQQSTQNAQERDIHFNNM